MIKRLIYALMSALLIGFGVSILIVVGLPTRADYTGFRLPDTARPIAPEINSLAPPFPALIEHRGKPIIVNFLGDMVRALPHRNAGFTTSV